MHLRVVVVAALSLVVASSAMGHDNGGTWSERKAERVAKRDATVRVPRSLDARVQEELWTLIARYRTLEQVALDLNDQQAASRIHNIRYRYSTALLHIEEGLGITVARCDGTGPAVNGSSFRHFRCSVTSKRLEIPSVELVYHDENTLPEIVERAPQRYGPYEATLLLHATGASSIAFRQLGDSRAQ